MQSSELLLQCCSSRGQPPSPSRTSKGQETSTKGSGAQIPQQRRHLGQVGQVDSQGQKIAGRLGRAEGGQMGWSYLLLQSFNKDHHLGVSNVRTESQERKSGTCIAEPFGITAGVKACVFLARSTSGREATSFTTGFSTKRFSGTDRQRRASQQVARGTLSHQDAPARG